MAKDHHVQASEYDTQSILYQIMSTHRIPHIHNGIENPGFVRYISGDAQNIIVPAHQTNSHGKISYFQLDNIELSSSLDLDLYVFNVCEQFYILMVMRRSNKLERE